MLFYQTILIVIASGGSHYATLFSAIHGELVDIIAGLVIGFEPTVSYCLVEILASHVVDGVGVNVGSLGAIDFGTCDVEQTNFVASSQSGGFLTVHDIVGRARDSGNEIFRWAQGLEWLNSNHGGGQLKENGLISK